MNVAFHGHNHLGHIKKNLDSHPNFVKNWGRWEVYIFFYFSDCFNEQNSPERNI